ncbi:hypothetical protein IB286_05460 [Spongiibacter sp. KMU-158]|uniref:OmpA family protein n=1 Tax=Spongiibacter pelagi TaxID=2760804 RepID=A0A927GW08_9GAMM|nr:hypothetical protein [Spongiibacter pelagi]MBD2858452.1 hypothetical protein [Spongiibacter pelagi]
MQMQSANAQVIPAGIIDGSLGGPFTAPSAGGSVLGAPADAGLTDVGSVFGGSFDGFNSGQDILLLGAPLDGSDSNTTDPSQVLLDGNDGQLVMDFLQNTDIEGALITPEVTTIMLPTSKSLSCTDTDHDGVCDEKDYCPDTPTDAVAFFWGCHISLDHALPLNGVEFEQASAELKVNAVPVLRKLASFLKGSREIHVRIRYLKGTSDRASDELIDLRLASIKNFLLREGVDSQRFELAIRDKDVLSSTTGEMYSTDVYVDVKMLAK